QGLDRTLPTRLVPWFGRRFSIVTEELAGFPVHIITPRHRDPERTVLFVHGGGYMAPADPFHLVHVARLATTLRARIVLPDYPLAPEHTWRDSFGPLTDLAARWAADSRLTLFGDSAGGGYALALAMALRDRGGPQPSELLLYSPWVDLTTSTPDTPAYDAVDPWLFLGKVEAYAGWWAGSPADLDRPEVSPGLGDLDGLPRALMFCGTRDLLVPGCRLLASRAADADWNLTYVEEPDLLHVYPLLPLVPEARRAWHTTVGFLR
ncbi:MAG: alpha/beta hydrolase, partial [Nocardioides sp.]